MNAETQVAKTDQEISWPSIIDDGITAIVICFVAWCFLR